MRARRRGSALLAVLWVMVGISALALAVSLSGRDAVAVTRNRTDLIRAAWRAEECMARARAAIAEALNEPPVEVHGVPTIWVALDRVVMASPVVNATECNVSLRPAGVALDLNAVNRESLYALLRALGTGPERADSLADALLDWRDGDGVPRPYGVERPWYEERARRPPRDGPFADPRELRYVRGFATFPGIDTVLGVEPGRISLEHAPRAVLAALPGMSAEVVDRILDRRRRGVPVGDLASITSALSTPARDSLIARYADLARSTTTDPDAWVAISRATHGGLPLTAAVELRLVRAGNRVAIVRRRTWIE